MSTISNAAASWINAITSSSNWVQSAASSSSTGAGDWMDSDSSQNPSAQDLGAAAENAIVEAEQSQSSSLNSDIINNAVTALESQSSGQSVDVTA